MDVVAIGVSWECVVGRGEVGRSVGAGASASRRSQWAENICSPCTIQHSILVFVLCKTKTQSEMKFGNLGNRDVACLGVRICIFSFLTWTTGFLCPASIALTGYVYTLSIIAVVGDLITWVVWSMVPGSCWERDTSWFWTESLWRKERFLLLVLSTTMCITTLVGSSFEFLPLKEQLKWKHFSPAAPQLRVSHSPPMAQTGESSSFSVTVPCSSSCFNQQRELQFHRLLLLLPLPSPIRLRPSENGRGIFTKTSGFRVVSLFCCKEMNLMLIRWLKIPSSRCDTCHSVKDFWALAVQWMCFSQGMKFCFLQGQGECISPSG